MRLTQSGDDMYRNAGISAPDAFWRASKGTRDSMTGGCGAGKLGDILVPDTIWGLRVTFMCRIHDWRYFFGKTIEDKDSADREFLNNLLRWIDYKTKCMPLRWLRHRRALKYFEAVQSFGGPAFWNGKEEGSDDD